MNRPLQQRLRLSGYLLAGMTICAIGALAVRHQPRNTLAPLRYATRQELNLIIIPRIEMANASLESAVASLNEAVTRVAPKSVRFDIARHPDLPQELKHGLSSRTGGVKTIDLALSNMPLGELLRYIRGLFDCALAEREGKIVFLPDWRGEVEPLETRTFRTKKLVGISPQVWLQDRGVPFGKGCSATLVWGGRYLRITNTAENVDMCEAVNDQICDGRAGFWEDPAYRWVSDQSWKLKTMWQDLAAPSSSVSQMRNGDEDLSPATLPIGVEKED